MKPEDFTNSKTFDQVYMNQISDDDNDAKGIILACAIGVWLWMAGYSIWLWIVD